MKHGLAFVVLSSVMLIVISFGFTNRAADAATPALARYRAQRGASVSSTFTVNSILDESAEDPSQPVCSSTPSHKCTLRAAIMRANFASVPATITLPAGSYVLTRPGYDDSALVGDLDILHNLTIQGAGSGVTIVNGNGSVTKDRVFQVLASATNVNMTGITIRNGQSLSSTVGVIGGGGLYLEGAGQLHLSNVIIDSNTGQNGGGLYSNFNSSGGSIILDNVILHANKAIAGGVGAGGGIYAHLPSGISQMAISNSRVYSNTADGTGGGLYVDGNNTIQWSIQRSEIYSNTAASGGAIGNFVPLVLSDSLLHNNRVTFDGGAIETFSPMIIVRTTLDANSAGRFGGAIFDLQTGSNAAYLEFNHIEQSTLSNNYAQYGGGIYHDGFIILGSLLTLLNSTLSGNGASRAFSGTGSADGGGIYIYGGQAQLLNTTIAMNTVNPGFGTKTHLARGGGVFITATAVITLQNTLLGNNLSSNGFTLASEDDCFSFGTVGTLAYDLIQTTANCFVTGPQGGLIVGYDPLLGPLKNNGGSTQTHALLPGSPAIDTGAPAGCTDDLGAPLTVDQRGWHRPYGLNCDIGAFEYSPFEVLLPLVKK